MDERIGRFIEVHEGRVDRPYQCPAGKWTIGVGRNFEDNKPTTDELRAIMAGGVPQAAINLMRDNDIKRSWIDMAAIFPSFTGWPPPRQAAVISIRYNLGLVGFLGFKNMIASLREGRWVDAAADSLDSERARQLPRRAAEEADLIRTGNWPT